MLHFMLCVDFIPFKRSELTILVMGCDHSSEAKKDAETSQDGSKKRFKNNRVAVSNEDIRNANKNSGEKVIDRNGNRKDYSTNNSSVPKPVAFAVSLEGKNRDDFTLPVPTKLKKLEPLNVPKLTAEMLEEKQKQAEQKREKALANKVNESRKASKRMRELMQAKEFKMQHQLEKIDDKLKSAENNKEAKLEEIKEKQRIKTDRAHRAQERMKKLNDVNMDIDVEKDDAYNESDGDSWHDEKERSSSPLKSNRSNNGARQTASASTVDSFDTAFQRNPPTSITKAYDHSSRCDDFFDT